MQHSLGSNNAWLLEVACWNVLVVALSLWILGGMDLGGRAVYHTAEK